MSLEELNSLRAALDSLLEELDLSLNELDSLRGALDSAFFFLVMPGILSLTMASRGPFTMAFSARWFSASLFFSTAVASRPAILSVAASSAHRLMSALLSGLSDFLEVYSTSMLACRATTASCSDEELALTHDMSAQV